MLIYRTKRVQIETRTVSLPNGRTPEYLFVKPVSAVCILPVDEEYVYLIRQYRAVIDAYIIEAPAGGMDHEGESPEDAVRRELAEETGMKAESLIPRGFVYTSPGFCTEKIWLYEARGLTPCSGYDMDEDEVIEQVKIPVRDIPSMICSGEISDAKTIAVLSRVLFGKGPSGVNEKTD
ncbi:MAG: NUDIX hydrolase [Methanocorpusculum sp.]|nr:NUDIX hydrolase [Methanocorpusculum sp.]